MPSATFNFVNLSSVNRINQLVNLYWREPGNAKLTGGDYSWLDDSSITKPQAGEGVTPFLCARELENTSSIPNNAIIKGIEITFKCRALVNAEIPVQDDFQFYTDQVTLSHSIDVTSTNKSPYRTQDWKKADDTWFTFTYGGPTDTWGLSLTPSIVKSLGRSGLGVSVSGWTKYTVKNVIGVG